MPDNSKFISRRSFIKWVINAGLVSACPFPAGASDRKDTSKPSIPKGKLSSETNAICHQVRDSEMLPMPEPGKTYDIVIIGAGASGLTAAYQAQDSDFLLLEKENQWGGNALPGVWEGLDYTTGSAWATILDDYVELKALYKKWNFVMKPIVGNDAAYFDGTWVPAFWDGTPDNPAIDQLPYSQSVKDSVRQFARDIQKIDYDKDIRKLDMMTFADILKGYAPQLKAYWDTYGPSNWGATSEHTSAYMGIQAAKDWTRWPRFTFEGGLAQGSRVIYNNISEKAKQRIELGATVYNVRKGPKKRMLVSFMKEGQAHTVAARAVVVAIPKFMARYIIQDLPDKQRDAMSRIRYAPYLTYNLFFDRVVYNQGFDNWVVGSKNLCDFTVFDWVTHGSGGDLKRKQAITIYAPLGEEKRTDLLSDEQVLSMAQAAVEELIGIFPGWLDHLREVQIYRRGHPLFMSTPGLFTRIQPEAGRHRPPVFFANVDTHADISNFEDAVLNGLHAAQKALKHL